MTKPQPLRLHICPRDPWRQGEPMHTGHGGLSLPICPSSLGQTRCAQPAADTRLVGSQEDMGLVFPGPLPLTVRM